MDDHRAELIRIAKAILDGSIEMLLGLRKIDSLRFYVGDGEDPVFFTIRGIASQADGLPDQNLLATYHEQHREQVAEEVRNFEQLYENDISKACIEILRKFENKIG